MSNKTAQQEKTALPPLVQQQEIGLYPVNSDLKGLEEAAPSGASLVDNAAVKPESIWTKLMCCLKRASRTATVHDPNVPPLTRAEKKEKKRLQKEEKELRKRERDKEIAEKEWVTYTAAEKTRFILFTILKFVLFIIFLYLFLLSLSFMTIGFTMVTYIALKIGNIIQFLLSNPFAALAIGIIATAIMQNATATTSIAVSMVGAGIISDVKSAIPIIMGSNIGTCVTNSFIALTMAGDPNEFKRAFSAATLNDGFNLLTTAILLPIEIIFGMLNTMSLALTNALLKGDNVSVSGINFIGAIIDPVTGLFIQLDTDAVNRLAAGDASITETALRCCSSFMNYTREMNRTLVQTILTWPNYTTSQMGSVSLNGITVNNISFDGYALANGTLMSSSQVCTANCTYWCMPMLKAFGDAGTGLFWIILSIVVLIASLFAIVKVASLIIVGPIAKHLSRALNAAFPGKLKWLSEVILFLVAFALTLIVQSSNIITATLVPLCGIGMITVQRVYVMTLGSNIGTTVTGILSAFTSPSSTLKKSLQLAFVYTFFNTLGVLFWLPIPPLRFPKRYSRKLGGVVFQYRWFIYCYVSALYFIGPLIMLGLALIPMWIGLAIVGIPLILAALSLLIIMLLRRFVPKVLPEKLKDFGWLPLWMRSLKPYDEKFKRMSCCRAKHKKELVVERRMSAAGVMEEMVVEKDVEEPDFIPSVIRRMSAIDSLVNEARVFARRNTIRSTSSGNSLPDIVEEHHEQSDSKENLEKPKQPRRFSLGFITQSVDENRQNRRRQTLHKIEPVDDDEKVKNEDSKF